jgi:hypothetical protein
MPGRSALWVPRPVGIAFLVAFLAGACLLGSAPARADRGVAIDLGEVTLTDPLSPGGGYRLPVIGISNPGDEPAGYRMTVSYLTGQEALEPPASWFGFDPAEFTLAPGETRAVRVRLSFPVDADAGDYEALLGAQIVTRGSGGQVGAAAASRLRFTVEPASTLEALWLKVERFLAAHLPWTYIVPAAVLALLGGWQLRRRYQLTVARR